MQHISMNLLILAAPRPVSSRSLSWVHVELFGLLPELQTLFFSSAFKSIFWMINGNFMPTLGLFCSQEGPILPTLHLSSPLCLLSALTLTVLLDAVAELRVLRLLCSAASALVL